MQIKIEISGITSLLMNRFVEDTGEKRDKNISAREAAEKVAYKDSNGLYLPADNIFSCIMGAGKFHKEGKSKITTARSSILPAGVLMEQDIVYFKKPTIFEVDSRPVVIPSTGGRIMKHRPRLDDWCLEFSVRLDTKMFTERKLREIVDDAGSKLGLGDFRPERKGTFGRFVVTEWKQVN